MKTLPYSKENISFARFPFIKEKYDQRRTSLMV